MKGDNLTGAWRVRATMPAMNEAKKLLPRTKDRMILRRHSLKLRYWPQKQPIADSGLVLDVDWSWIKAMPNSKVGELRIDDSIGGIANLRVIFFVGDDDKCHQNERPVIWILAVLQKKRDDFTTNNIKTYWARRQLVIQRFYDC